jgi:hypothetical protein
VGERLVFEVADRELDLGMLAMLSVNLVQILAAVGHEREAPPVGEELGLILLGVKMDTADDQPLASQRGLGELADARPSRLGSGFRLRRQRDAPGRPALAQSEARRVPNPPVP